MALLTCKNLCLGYDGKEIVRGLNFEINPGDYLCVIGENGSGKSTLMKTLLGLHPPLSGGITYGEGLSRKDIGYLPQQTVVQKDFPATVWEIVLSGCQGGCGLRPFYNREEKAEAVKNLEKVGMEGFAKRSYRELSGGQQQRVLLARALCAAKKLLVLDEPVSGLDPDATEEMYGRVKKLSGDGLTVVMITHDVEAALGYANKILRIGKDCFFGTKDGFVKDEYVPDGFVRDEHVQNNGKDGE